MMNTHHDTHKCQFKIWTLKSSSFSLNGTRKRRGIMYNATPKNGKPFVINETRSSIHFSTASSKGLVGENVISPPRYDTMMIFSYFTYFPVRNIFSLKRCVSSKLIRDFLKNVKSFFFQLVANRTICADCSYWSRTIPSLCRKVSPLQFRSNFIVASASIWLPHEGTSKRA